MTLDDIVSYTRKAVLSNGSPPYFWNDDELVLYANEALNIICREARILNDASTGSICNIHTSANVIDYDLSDYILYVKSARLLSSELMTLDVAPATAWAAADTITGATSTKTCTVVEYLTTLTYTVKTRSGEYTLGEILSNGTVTADQGATYPIFTDNSTSGVNLRKTTTIEMNRHNSGWRTATSGSPTQFLLDYRYGYISFYPPPDVVYTIVLSVIRYPSAVLSATSMSSQTPEIPSQYHHAIIDGIAWQAFLKTGDNTFNPQKSQTYYKLFYKQVSDMKINSGMYNANDSTIGPRRGFI
jgi:hypothetical protein